MTDSDKCPCKCDVCGENHAKQPFRYKYCPDAHEIAIERGEENEMLWKFINGLGYKLDAIVCLKKWKEQRKDNPSPEQECHYIGRDGTFYAGEDCSHKPETEDYYCVEHSYGFKSPAYPKDQCPKCMEGE